ncbi:BnaA06g13770D [Brassica napus]|uniref:BnaA06g13770D protein n=1 Tax=Brassica napus TaxID=3708 RepID=A0A078GW66_BRANA|nr:BnaA06g13770D [Brassica napus]
MSQAAIASENSALMNVFDKAPILDKEAFVTVILEEDHLHLLLMKRDVNTVSVGSGTNIQDNSLVHVAKSYLIGKVPPTIIGDNVIVLCYMDVLLRMRPLSRMGATLLDGVVVEKHDMVAAGACLFDKTLEFLPSGEIWGGNPSAENYPNLAKAHAAENAKPLNAIEFEKGQKDEEYDAMLSTRA